MNTSCTLKKEKELGTGGTWMQDGSALHSASFLEVNSPYVLRILTHTEVMFIRARRELQHTSDMTVSKGNLT